MRTTYIYILTLLLTVANFFSAFATGKENTKADSLYAYLNQAAINSPQVQSDFMLYKAALEKTSQAGALPDPELEIGLFINPMETLMGKQVADFSLMQMFPWFGTRKAARNEATEMARMAYEKFRESQNNLQYEVKAKWYQLLSLNEQYKNTEANIDLLLQLEKLAINKFTASSIQGKSMGNDKGMKSSDMQEMPVSPAGGMANMGNMSSSKSSPSNTSTPITSTPGMGGMSGSSMSSNTSGMSDILRIHIEIAELEDNLKNIASLKKVVEAEFNLLLNRHKDTPIAVSDTLIQGNFELKHPDAVNQILANNPMIKMIEAETAAYRAKTKMDKKMSMPMLGIGIQYSPMKKLKHPMGMENMNGKDMFMPMIKISLPIFRKKYNAQQREGILYSQASELKKTNARNILETEFLNLSNSLDRTKRKIDLYIKQKDLSQKAWYIILQEFSAGRQTLTDVITVERQLLEYQLKKNEAIADYNTTLAAIEKLISNNL